MSAIPELLRIVGKRHELDVENEKLKAEVERLKSMIERAMGPCSWPEYEKTKELPND
jgi:hypothetical protein